MKEQNIFRIRLKDYMETNRWTKAELARKANLSTPSIFSYLNGNREPSFTALKSICKAMNVSADYLLGLTDEVTRW